ncbi:hypothetical protein FJ364_05355 [Candidatus Dependentiae bacterium]|nr:hypothetical protein [Candidatus Dependentiae bacterium]
MTRTLGLLILTAATTQLQGSLYTEEALRKIESSTAIANAATTVVYAIAPEEVGSNLFVREVTGTTNKLMAYALLEQSNLMRFTRVLEAVAANESWHEAPHMNTAFMKTFAKEFAVAFTKGVTADFVSNVQNKALGKALGKNANRLVLRAADVAATTVTATLVEVLFSHLDAKINNKAELKSQDVIEKIGKTFFTELAYHLAGEIIRQGAEKDSYIADLVTATE